ncbi:MAG: prepilin-type N-terminal cleavage/methylation domain-containing protein [Candidatus Shapirobacteria bacterium]|nr:prepilin-type N-terminal cleavage/methylation domain-containing protein [Candidatus Shapirobacteria bacterium]
MNNKKGFNLFSAFTLIELLVVMTVIGVLAGLIVPNYMAARERARDAQRKSDLEQIQKALEMYKMDQSPPRYPDSLSYGLPLESGEEVYMKEIPQDPRNSDPYFYSYQLDSEDPLKYTLVACLENKSDPDGESGIGDCPDLGIEKTEP